MRDANEKHDGGPSQRPNYPIESVDNVLRLLILIVDHSQVRVTEASAEIGTAVSTAHRLLAMLAHHRFVVQDPETKVYKAGPVLLRLGLSAARNHDIRSRVRPYLEALRDEVGETVHVAVLQEREVLFVDCAESPKALRVVSRVGTSMWAHCTSVGKAWLACEPDESLRALYRTAQLPGLTEHSIRSRTKLLAELKEIRRLGYAHNRSESEEGVGSVSAVVHDDRGRPIAGISIAVPLARMPEDRWADLAAAVMRTAGAIESALS